jgi:hypothetical protein
MKSSLLDRENKITELQNKLFLSDKISTDRMMEEKNDYDHQLTQIKIKVQEIYQEK